MRSPTGSFTEIETRELTRCHLAERPLVCPRCAVALDRRPVPPRPDVSYVRDRLWVLCPNCHRSAVLDRREAR